LAHLYTTRWKMLELLADMMQVRSRIEELAGVDGTDGTGLPGAELLRNAATAIIRDSLFESAIPVALCPVCHGHPAGTCGPSSPCTGRGWVCWEEYQRWHRVRPIAPPTQDEDGTWAATADKGKRIRVPSDRLVPFDRPDQKGWFRAKALGKVIKNGNATVAPFRVRGPTKHGSYYLAEDRAEDRAEEWQAALFVFKNCGMPCIVFPGGDDEARADVEAARNAGQAPARAVDTRGQGFSFAPSPLSR
jgi:hypothetical protein